MPIQTWYRAVTVKAMVAIMTPIDVVPISPVFVRATPMHTAASAIVVIIDVVFRKNRNWKKATHGVVIIFANW